MSEFNHAWLREQPTPREQTPAGEGVITDEDWAGVEALYRLEQENEDLRRAVVRLEQAVSCRERGIIGIGHVLEETRIGWQREKDQREAAVGKAEGLKDLLKDALLTCDYACDLLLSLPLTGEDATRKEGWLKRYRELNGRHTSHLNRHRPKATPTPPDEGEEVE